MKCTICNTDNHLFVRREIFEPDRFELALKISREKYCRRWIECTNCQIAINVHSSVTERELRQIEDRYYFVDFPDGDLRSKYERIMALPAHSSDNAGRVQRVQEFLSKHCSKNAGFQIVDVGAGLGVFLSLFCDTFTGLYKVLAVETDPMAASHLKSLKKFQVHEGFLDELPHVDIDLLTVNKVLEHIKDPVSFLNTCRKKFHKDGHIYVEVPDISGLNVLPSSDNILGALHHNLYSITSLSQILSISGFNVVETGQLTEPSGKITCFAFGRTD